MSKKNENRLTNIKESAETKILSDKELDKAAAGFGPYATYTLECRTCHEIILTIDLNYSIDVTKFVELRRNAENKHTQETGHTQFGLI
ncbi:MAG TPA: hypothetical protein VHR42_04510 [Clostridia bacterium]|nr:hypothetical protein [Clostridia bacterium]